MSAAVTLALVGFLAPAAHAATAVHHSASKTVPKSRVEHFEIAEIKVKDTVNTDRARVRVDGQRSKLRVIHGRAGIRVRLTGSRATRKLTVSAVATIGKPSIRVSLMERRPSAVKTSGSKAAADPSGVPMPTTPPAGYRQVMADDFTGSTDRCWSDYSANPIPSSPTGAWVPGDVSYSGGEMVLSSSYDSALGKWGSGGVSSAPCVSQAYGIYEIRFRMDKANGVKYTIVNWPTEESWPAGGELDWGEDGGGNRSITTITSHYGVDGTDEVLPRVHIAGNFSKWNTLELDWTPGNEMIYLNGALAAHIASPEVPSDPMAMDIQTETTTNCALPSRSCIDSSTPAVVNMDVDWVVVYAPAS